VSKDSTYGFQQANSGACKAKALSVSRGKFLLCPLMSLVLEVICHKLFFVDLFFFFRHRFDFDLSDIGLAQ
jgi:hypothetical protein